MEATSVPLQPPTYGNFITVLSIDGGGIRGLIPGTILSFLESELQVYISRFINYSAAEHFVKRNSTSFILSSSYSRLFVYAWYRSWMVKMQESQIILMLLQEQAQEVL
jgi:hypothetical protein